MPYVSLCHQSHFHHHRRYHVWTNHQRVDQPSPPRLPTFRPRLSRSTPLASRFLQSRSHHRRYHHESLRRLSSLLQPFTLTSHPRRWSTTRLESQYLPSPDHPPSSHGLTSLKGQPSVQLKRQYYHRPRRSMFHVRVPLNSSQKASSKQQAPPIHLPSRYLPVTFPASRRALQMSVRSYVHSSNVAQLSTLLSWLQLRRRQHAYV